MAKRNFSKMQYVGMFIEASLLLPLIHVLAFLLPYKSIYSFSKKVGRLILVLAPDKKKIIQKNLSIINPQKSYSNQEFDDICEIIAGYELRIILEMINFSKMDFHQLISYIELQEHDQISKVYKLNKFVAFTMHYGNWELIGSLMYNIGFPLTCIVERQFNPWIDDHLQGLRKKIGILPVYNEISEMRTLFKSINNGHSVAVVADQTYWFDPMFIPFFSKEAAVPQGIVSLVNKTKLPLAYGYTRYKTNGIYQYHIQTDIISSSDNEVLMKEIYSHYEKTIQQNVQNWYTLGSDRWGLTRESLKEWKKNPDSFRF